MVSQVIRRRNQNVSPPHLLGAGADHPLAPPSDPASAAHYLDPGQPFRQNIPQMVEIERDATRRRGARRRRQMEKNRRTTVPNRRRIIPSKNAYHVINGVGAPEFFVPGRIRQADSAIIGRVTRIVAPPVVPAQRFDGAGSPRRRHPVGPIQNAAQRQNPGRCCPVAFNLVAGDAAPAKACGEAVHAEPQETVWRKSCEDHGATIERLAVGLKRLLQPCLGNALISR
jgi:hypothetical protein